jgi:hypothetical protein
MDVALKNFLPLPLRESFKIFHRGGITVAHGLKENIVGGKQVRVADN